jgi:hypothetical protein
MGLLTKLGIGRAARGAVGSTQARFMKTLDRTDLDVDNADVTTVAGQWTKINAGYIIPAQQTLHYGYGTPAEPDNQGYLYIYLEDTSAAETIGKVRLVQSNAQETVKFVIAEYNLASTHGSRTNKAMQIALPEQTQFPLVGEDSLVYLEVYTKTASSVDKDNSYVYIPVTIYM